MLGSKEPLEDGNYQFNEEFPYPKLINLFNYFFPKTKYYPSVGWRKKLRAWARFAPFLTLALLFLMICLGKASSAAAFLAPMCVFIGISSFLFLLFLALILKLARRSPLILIALTSIASFGGVVFLCLVSLWFNSSVNDFERTEAALKKAREDHGQKFNADKENFKKSFSQSLKSFDFNEMSESHNNPPNMITAKADDLVEKPLINLLEDEFKSHFNEQKAVFDEKFNAQMEAFDKAKGAFKEGFNKHFEEMGRRRENMQKEFFEHLNKKQPQDKES